MAMYWPQGCPRQLDKGYHRIWEANLQPLGPIVLAPINILDINVLAFISNLGPNNKAKNAQSWPLVFSAPTPSVKWALL
jgi:hypothetical protein